MGINDWVLHNVSLLSLRLHWRRRDIFYIVYFSAKISSLTYFAKPALSVI